MEEEDNPEASFLDAYNMIPGDLWIDKLHFAFDEADQRKTGALRKDEWINSKLRYLLADEYLNDQQMKDYFERIDANCDGELVWEEIVSFLMTHGNTFCSQICTDKKLKIKFEAPDEQTMKKTHRATKILKVMYLATQGQILTLSESSLTVWQPHECTPILTISDGPFVDLCLIPSLSKLAIAKPNRQILFYDVRNYKKWNVMMSATVVNSMIPKMSEELSMARIVKGKRTNIPMFNRPTAIIGHTDQPIIFVGDEDGRLEVFLLYTSRDAIYDWTYKRIRVEHMHTDAITQITYLPQNDSYISSSSDGSIIIWRYDAATTRFQKVYSFRNNDGLAITSFVYDKRTKDICYATNAHYFGIWRTFTTQYEHVETQRTLVSTMAIVPLGNDFSFCVTISKDNFVSIYKMPNLELITSYYMGLQHALCPPTGAICINNYLYLAGAFLSMWKCDDGANDGLTAHAYPIVSVVYNNLFSRVLSIDHKGEIVCWNPANSQKAFNVSLNAKRVRITCMVQDPSERRFGIGYSNGMVKIVSSNSASVLATLDKSLFDGPCTSITFGTVLKAKRILCCSKKNIVMFEDISGNRTSFVRNFLGHNDEVISTNILKERFVLSIGSGREMFLWNIQQQNPIVRYELPAEPSIAVEIDDDPEKFICGDVHGYVHIMSIHSPNPLSSFKGVELTMTSAITTMILNQKLDLFIVGNMHGYVKIYMFANQTFKEVRRFRAHTEAVTSLALSDDHDMLVTSGRDEEIKLWKLNPFALIGEFGKARKWNSSDPSSFLVESGVKDDPTHFVEPLKAIRILTAQERLENKQENENAETGPKLESREIPPFSFDLYELSIENLEAQCESGRKNLQQLMMRPDDMPKTCRPVRPPPSILYRSLADDRDMSNTLKRVENQLIALEKNESKWVKEIRENESKSAKETQENEPMSAKWIGSGEWKLPKMIHSSRPKIRRPV